MSHMNCVDSRTESVEQMDCVKCGVGEQTPCLCGLEVLGHTKIPNGAIFRACLKIALSSRDPYNAYQTTHKQQLPYWRLWYSMFSLPSAKRLIYKRSEA